MNINSIINQINNVFNAQQATPVNSDALAEGIKNGMKLLTEQGNNSVISGKVVSIDGEKILLSLGENSLLEATLEQELNPEVGQTMSFAVKGAQTGKVTLSPLFENLNQQSTVNSALKAAGMPDTPQNQYMVKTMMEEGLPIDKDSLYSMGKALKMNATADVLDLAKMTRLNIPLNEDMVNAFKNYENVEHQIINTIGDVSDSLVESFTNMIEITDNPKEALEFLVNIENILAEDIDVADDSISNLTDEAKNITQNSETTKAEECVGNKDIPADGESVGNKDISADGKSANAADNQAAIDKGNIKADIKNAIGDNGDMSLPKTGTKNVTEVPLNENGAEVKNTDGNVSKSEVKSFFDNLKNALSEPLGDKEVKDLATQVKNTISSDNFKDTFKQMLTDKYLLKPEEIGEEGKVQKLYERLESEIKSVNNFLEQAQKQDTPIANTINNINQNLDFMNQLNQTFNYVQIPLKLANQQSTGELYVYSNKKSLAQSDGNVSALLHLDMDNLGPVDVHVLLNNNNNVKTKFMLKDDAALDLIAENIDILNSRLEKRGYQMTSEFVNNKDPKTVMETILDDNKNIAMISTASFDARA